jgi:outer membrane protein OmpA-like peptidoglycan-associated protein
VSSHPEKNTSGQTHKNENQILAENNLPVPTSEQHQIIREMVAMHLKEQKNNEPIELAPLYFNLKGDELSVVDVNPFLIAVEFALQGRTIVIEDHINYVDSYSTQLSAKRIQKIRQLMHEMGVPEERISFAGYGEEVAMQNSQGRQERKLNQRVDFKAI